MPDYQKRLLAGSVDEGDPGPLPADLVGLADADLANLNWTYEPLGYHGYGFFPLIDVPTRRVLTRLQYTLALAYYDPTGIVFGAVDALDPTDDARVYFDNTANFDRDDARYDAVEAMLGATEANTDLVFAYGATVAP